MTQEEVLTHVLANDCHTYEQKIKDDGIYYFVRRNGTKKMVVIYPLVKHPAYTEAAICHICSTLGGIPIPDYAKNYMEVVAKAKRKADILEQFPPTGSN